MLSPGGRDARESAIGDDKPYHGNTLRTMGAQGGSTTAGRILCGVGRVLRTRRSSRSSREPPGHDGRFDDHRPRELRRALTALDERDWHFRASKTGARGFPGELHDERVAVRADRGEWQPLECLPAPAPEATGAIANRHPRDRADIAIRECA